MYGYTTNAYRKSFSQQATDSTSIQVLYTQRKRIIYRNLKKNGRKLRENKKSEKKESKKWDTTRAPRSESRGARRREHFYLQYLHDFRFIPFFLPFLTNFEFACGFTQRIEKFVFLLHFRSSPIFVQVFPYTGNFLFFSFFLFF